MLAQIMIAAAALLANPAAVSPQPQTSSPPAESRVESAGSVSTPSGTLKYVATAGTVQLGADSGKPKAELFYVAYELKRPAGAPARPVTFFFNGGPGSSSMWLHLGSFSPVRLTLPAVGQQGAARLAPNPYTLLAKTDLVFIDAIGTGLSRPYDAATTKEYWGNDQDAAAFTEGVARWLTVSHRWDSPKYLFGESYGTMRAAIMAPKLHSRGIDLNGIILMSTILNFGHFAPGLDQAAIDLLPTYAATALHFGKIPARPGGLEQIVRQARDYARGPYAEALSFGDRIPEARRVEVADRLHALTGLSKDYLLSSDLRVGLDRFRRQLLRDQRLSTGALDTRITGFEGSGVGDHATYDPAEASFGAPFASAINSYLVDRLGYSSGRSYIPGDGPHIMGAWDWSHQPADGERQNSLADSVPDLALAMRLEPAMRILSLNGYYDLMTPFFGAEFDLSRLGREAVHRVSYRYYLSGHMIYLDDRVMPALVADLCSFYDATAPLTTNLAREPTKRSKSCGFR